MIAVLMLTATAAVHAQSFNPSWRLLDLGECFGCSGILSVDLDGDGNEEIIAGRGVDPYSGLSEIAVVYTFQGTEYVPVWTSDWHYPQRIARVTTADRDGDGRPELFLITAGGRVDAVDVMNNTTVFTATYEIDPTVVDGAVLDVDQDGALEVVLASAHSVRVFDLESGTEEQIYDIQGARNLFVAQVDADAGLEILVDANDYSNPAGYVLDASTGTIEWTYYGGFAPQLAFGDVTGDGIDDAIGINQQGYVTAFDGVHRTPVWQFHTPQTVVRPHIHIADTDGDGTQEILVPDGGDGLRAYTLDASPTLLWTKSLLEGAPVSAFTTGDTNGDGLDELIGSVGYRSKLVVARMSDMTQTWTSDVRVGPFRTFPVDFDGDGELEVVGLNLNIGREGLPTLDVLSATGEMMLTNEMQWPITFESRLHGVTDLDGNGTLEAVLTYHDRIGVVDVSTGRLLREGLVSLDGWSHSASALAIADVDGDGIQEFIVGIYGWVLILDSQTFTPMWQSIFFDAPVMRIWVMNVDDDPALELIFAGNIVQAYDLETFLLEWQVSTDSYVLGFDVVDFNGDGVADYVLGLENGTIQIIDGVSRAVLAAASLDGGRVWDVDVVNVDMTPAPEIVAANTRVSVIRLSDLETVWQSIATSHEYNASGTIHVLDLDGNGRTDILQAGPFGVFRYEATGRYLDVVMPRIVAHTPIAGFSRAGTTTRPSVTFSERIDEATLTSSSVIVSADGVSVTYDLELDATGTRLTIVPNAPLPPNSDIVISLTPAIADTSGLPLDGNGNRRADGPLDVYSWQFTTGASADVNGPFVVIDQADASTWLGLPYRIEVTAVDTSSEGSSAIARIEAHLGSMGPDGSGIPLEPANGSYVSSIERGVLVLATEKLASGDNVIYIRAKDATDNWGEVVEVTVNIVDWQSDNWTTVGGSVTRSGDSETVIETPMTERWHVPLPEAEQIMQPIIVDGTVYTSWRDRSGRVHASAYELWNGDHLWTTLLSPSDLANPITYAYGRIYTQASGDQESNQLVAISAEDGSILWSHDVSAFSSWTSYGAPTPVNGVILFPGEFLTSMDAVTGERLYSLPSWGPVGWAASTTASEAYVYESGILKAVNPASGVLRWELPLTNESAINSLVTPALDADRGLLYLVSYNHLVAAHVETREVAWTRSGYYQHGPAIGEGEVYVFEHGRLAALAPETGELMWELEIGYDVSGAFVVAGRTLLSRGFENTYAIDLDQRKVAWTIPHGGEIGVADGTMILARVDYNVPDESGIRAFISAGRVNVEPNVELPAKLALKGNYPNPFNPVTTIEFALPQRSHVRLSVFDALGREVALLVDELHDGGTHHVAFVADGLPSGVYFARLEAEGVVQTGALTLLK